MQKEKKNVLIVLIAAIVIIGVAIGLFFLISFVKDRNYKKEHWFESDTTIITIQNDHTKEGKQEVKLKDYLLKEKDYAIVVKFTLNDDSYITNPQIGIYNDWVEIRSVKDVQEVVAKDYVRSTYSPTRIVDDEEGVYDKLTFLLYKNKDNDSIEYFKTIEVRLYYNYTLNSI